MHIILQYTIALVIIGLCAGMVQALCSLWYVLLKPTNIIRRFVDIHPLITGVFRGICYGVFVPRVMPFLLRCNNIFWILAVTLLCVGIFIVTLTACGFGYVFWLDTKEHQLKKYNAPKYILIFFAVVCILCIPVVNALFLAQGIDPLMDYSFPVLVMVVFVSASLVTLALLLLLLVVFIWCKFSKEDTKEKFEAQQSFCRRIKDNKMQ